MAIINLAVSVVCLKLWGLIGVFVGTLVSYLLMRLNKEQGSSSVMQPGHSFSGKQ